jgi:hypothetical protein
MPEYYEYKGKKSKDWRTLLSPELLKYYGTSPTPPTGLTGLKVIQGELPAADPTPPPAITSGEIAGIEAEMLPGIESAYAPITERQIGSLQRALAESQQRQTGVLERTLAARGLTYGGAVPAGAERIAELGLAELGKGVGAIREEAMRGIRSDLGTRLQSVLAGIEQRKAREWQSTWADYLRQKELEEEEREKAEALAKSRTRIVYGGQMPGESKEEIASREAWREKYKPKVGW